MSSIGHSFVDALRPAPTPFAFAGAMRALLAAGVIAVLGVWRGDLQVVGVAYLGAACAVSFATAGVYRNRLVALLAQGVGAALGIAIGVTGPSSAVGLILIAAIGGLVSGLIGGVGPNGPAFGMMLTIGVAFGQFGGSTLSCWAQSLWYLIGTVVVAIAALTPWVLRRKAPQRRAAAAVFVAAADLCEAVGTPEAGPARRRLAAVSAAAREAGHLPSAELTAFAVAAIYGEGRAVPGHVVEAVRLAGRQVLGGKPICVQLEVATGDPGLERAGLAALADALSPAPTRLPAPPRRRLHAIVRTALTRTAFLNGMRMALCLAVATAVTVELDRPAHGFWLPLTVAVIVRPEYASVFVRTVNRLAGTLVGAGAAAVVLSLLPHGLPTASAAALALSFAVFSAPKSYAVYVIGITASTLLAVSVGPAEPILPAVRLLDTVVGAAIAVVFGYLLWPGARGLPGVARLDRAVEAARSYLAEAVQPQRQRMHWQARRDDAYRLAHQLRSASETALVEPPPVNALALQLIPLATRLEDAIDATTALAAAVDSGEDVTPRANGLNDELAAVAEALPSRR